MPERLARILECEDKLTQFVDEIEAVAKG